MSMYFRSAGADQHKIFAVLSPTDRKTIEDAQVAIAAEQFQVAEKLLAPLVAQGNAEALYLTALFSVSGEDEKTFEQRHLKQIQMASSKKFAPALFALGVYADTGEGVPHNNIGAAQLFKEAAELGHPHAQWIYAMDLLYGRNGISIDIDQGIHFLRLSIAGKFEGAIQTAAEFYEKGVFEFPVDLAKAQELRELLKDADVIGY